MVLSCRMIEVLVVCLVLCSVVSAGFWSPKPNHDENGNNNNKGGEDVIVKEGHRVVVVEYDPNTDGKTKVFISPEDHSSVSQEAKETLSSATNYAKGKAKETLDDAKGKAGETFNEAKEKAKEAASVLPNLGQGISGLNGRGPREVVCDAFGKCKEKITSAMGKAKDKASEATHEITETAHNVEEHAREKVSETAEKTKEKIYHKADEISTKAHEAKERAEHVVKDVSSKVEEAKAKGERELGEIFLRMREMGKRVREYLIGLIHLLGFATAYGMCIWVTFISSYVLAGALPRQQFGIVQSKVYPVYFKMLAYCVIVTLVGHLYEQRTNLFQNSVGMAQALTLLGSFGTIMFNLLYLEPRATKVMFVRMKMEKEEGRGLDSEPTARVTDRHLGSKKTPLQSHVQENPEFTDAETLAQINKLGERLKNLNAYSSFLNILTLMALTSHLVYLGQRLHVTC